MNLVDMFHIYYAALWLLSFCVPSTIYWLIWLNLSRRWERGHRMFLVVLISLPATYFYLLVFGLIPDIYISARADAMDLDGDLIWSDYELEQFDDAPAVMELLIHDTGRALLPFTAVLGSIFASIVSLGLLRLIQIAIGDWRQREPRRE